MKILLALLLAFSPPIFAMAQTASSFRFSGTIVDPSGAQIGGATILVRNPSGSSQATTKSDRDGAFSLSSLTPGSYRLVVSSPAFATKDILITLGPTDPHLRIALAVAAVNTTVDVKGRADDLIGIADSATQGTVGAAEIAARPILRSGEVLETVPGLIITQHAGGGKANQYFLRGFNLDHGTDFAIFLDGMPLNLPSHAHGEGYSDMNTVIPEFVQSVNFEKGPYYGDVGNYGSAGSVHLDFFRSLPHNFLQVEGGQYGYGRGVFGISHPLGQGTLLLGGEVSHDDGPWIRPDNYLKLNGIVTYSQAGIENSFSLTARGYHGDWNSSDQIAATAIQTVGLFGTLNPTDGGHSQRYSLQGAFQHRADHSETRITAYGFFYTLNLFSDFTYFLTDPDHGDQFNQKDRRWVTGFDARHTIYNRFFGRRSETTLGLQLRNDWLKNGLYQSRNRVQVAKVDSGSGNPLPATTQADRLTDTQPGFYVENRIQWAERFRSDFAIRGDIQHFNVTSLITPANSGSATKVLPSPKLSLTFGPFAKTEFYTQAGFSFHSNDGRGTTQHVEPVSGENPEPNTPATPVPPLIPTKGGEFGIRTVAVPHLQSTVSLWYLHSASELQQSGDTGGTTASQQPSRRYGIEWANFYTPSEHLSVDFDLAGSRALFTEIDPDDAAPDSPGGKRVPEAVGLVISSGITLHDYKGFTSSLRLRFFGPRDLTSDSLYRSKPTALLNAGAGYRFAAKYRVSAELLNLLNRKDHDIDYAYTNQISPAAAPAFTNVFHPVEPFQVRFALARTF